MASDTSAQASQWSSIVNIVLGLWLIVSPFIFNYSNNPVALWNNIIFGAIIAVVAFFRASNPSRNVSWSWVNLVLGLWILIAPFVLVGYPTPSPHWNNLIVGALVAILAWVSASQVTATHT